MIACQSRRTYWHQMDKAPKDRWVYLRGAIALNPGAERVYYARWDGHTQAWRTRSSAVVTPTGWKEEL